MDPMQAVYKNLHLGQGYQTHVVMVSSSDKLSSDISGTVIRPAGQEFDSPDLGGSSNRVVNVMFDYTSQSK